MFKKPLGHLKTSSALRSSDRRKLKQRVISTFGCSAEDGDVLVPEGIQSIKFTTHMDAPGVAYLDADDTPLWFSLGKAGDDLIPTVYTLWKRPELLPFVTTPSQVISILIGGADLMRPGVTSYIPGLQKGQLVAVRRLIGGASPKVSPPLAVGHMALSSDELKEDHKGKAVLITHTWKDHLWEMGPKTEPPEDTPLTAPTADVGDANGSSKEPDATPTLKGPVYTPAEVSQLLHLALVQSIATSPPSSFPVPSNTFYASHVLPSRPAFPDLVLPPATSPANLDSAALRQEISLKTSSHKSLAAFLKAAEKAGLLTVKATPKQKNDVMVTSVNTTHPDVTTHRQFPTVREVEEREAKREARKEELSAKEEARGSMLEATELWKPHMHTVPLFVDWGLSTSEQYTFPELKRIFNNWLEAHPEAINPHERAYISLKVPAASSLVAAAYPPNKKGTPPAPEFAKREDILRDLIKQMQPWYEVKHANGERVTRKKGTLKPVNVAHKIRQGRKAATIITGFEPFEMAVNSEEMAEDLRKICASATSVAPGPNKQLEVLVQGKQAKTVVEYLVKKGIPKNWIQTEDQTKGKK
uniref:SUI1 domain-containing protein n=1 Tax=Schizophyllum commune (strain H4-8 / FGSC 9210) TaxID=578458 RepID=D8QDE9_SCHCM